MKSEKLAAQKTKKIAKTADQFHDIENFSAPQDWKLQTWNLKDQCCGGGKIEVILPNDWRLRVNMALDEARKQFPKEARFLPKTGEDGNSHLAYIDSGYILQQALLFGESNEELILTLAAKPKGLYYTVSHESGDKDFTSFKEALKFFQKKDKP